MQNPASPHLAEPDIRLIVSMLGEVAAMEGDDVQNGVQNGVQKKRRLLAKLAEVVGADKWLWALRVQNSTTDAASFAGLLHGGFSPEQIARIAESAAHPCVKEIDAPFVAELARSKAQLTMRLEDYDTRQLWPGSPAAELARQAGVGTFLASTRPLEEGKASVVALYRQPDTERFTERDRLLAHLVLSEVDWIHSIDWQEEGLTGAVGSLSRSHLILLSLLIQGNGRQEIADLIHLSPHTINSYVKTIFQHFEVKSQPELMRQFLFGPNGEPLA